MLVRGSGMKFRRRRDGTHPCQLRTILRPMHVKKGRLRFVFLIVMPLQAAALLAEPLKLSNSGLSVEIDGASGAITSLTNRLTNDRHAIRTVPWRLETDKRAISPTVARASGSDEHNAWFEH